MDRKIRRWLVLWLITVLAMAAVATAETTKPVPATTAPLFTEVTLKKGSITQNVIATGSLRFDAAESLRLPEKVTLQTIEVKEGESVSKGQVLARYDEDALKVSLREARDALAAQEKGAAQLLAQQSSDQSIQTAVTGVVKQLNLEAGQMVQQTLEGRAAAVLSCNGLMQVSIEPSEPLILDQAVRVAVGTVTYTGSVARLKNDGSALITFSDARALIDETVQVTLNGNLIGEGKAQANLPYLLYTQSDGVVSSVSVSLNNKVNRNATIYRVSNAEPSREYLETLNDCEDLRQLVISYEEMLESPVFICEVDGIVAQVSAKEGAALQKGTELLKLYAGSALVLDVAVDELDILSVQPGHKGTASLDAIKNVQLPVSVEEISLLGNNNSGITTYTVTLSIQNDERLRSGMNGTATLKVGEALDSVLVPLAALMSDRSGSYVLLKNEGEVSETGAPGAKTYVKVGLSDASYAVVAEGLEEGDVVLVRNTALPSTQITQQMQPGLNNMMNPNRQGIPGGGRNP
ncbi:MAG: HlyD family efflux transporter periplasmic adaptor subunit [Eubacteriales bacterium]|nr:HlyD family efflux transporter periplasmic adaptor subunit [Eubacteriales bacterium]